MKLFVLAGTEDGRELAEDLRTRGHDILVSTLTTYGADLALEQGLQVRSGALNAQTLAALIEGGGFAAIVDATHPYAIRVKEMVKKVCEELSIPYLRWQRPSLYLPESSLIHWAENISDAGLLAAELGHHILLTTGSNALPEWMSLPSLQGKKLYIRVLPNSQVLARCELLGFKPNQIIAAQGPFSQEWDEAMFKQLNIEVVITKESGKVGGTLEKVQACHRLNIPLVILKRPMTDDKDSSRSQFIKHLEEIL